MNMKGINDHTILSAKSLRQRKFLLFLPVLILPFLTLLLWTLGIVGEIKAGQEKRNSFSGLNLNLPSAAPAKDSAWNKMKYYEQAERDSAKLRSYLKSDPYRRLELGINDQESALDTTEMTASKEHNLHNSKRYYNPYPSENKKDDNEEKVYKKLEALNRELATMDEQQNPALKKSEQSNKTAEVINPDIARLETMMQAIQTEPTENKELSQLNEMLDKIMQIQHPENDFMQDSLQKLSANNKRKVFTVSTPEENIVSVIQPATGLNTFFENLSKDSLPDSIQKAIETNRFYSLDEPGLIETEGKAITAIVQENQTLVSGATVKLRVLDEMYIAGVHIPKDQFVYGVATLSGERLSITVSSITYNKYLLPVSLVVYDMDGLAGIHVPGTITRDVAKRSAAQSVQGLGTLSTLDPSLGAQMATAGLQAAQNLLGKSVKLIRVHLLSGYRVLLKDESRKDK